MRRIFTAGHRRFRRWWPAAFLAGLSVLLSACGRTSAGNSVSAAPAQPNSKVAAVEPTATHLPPTATPRPTASPTPRPTSTPKPTPTAAAPAGPSFSADVQPIFNERCIKCHFGQSPPRGLRLTDYDNILKGGTYRTVVIPGKPEESEMVKRIKGEAIPRMPFDGPPFLSDDQITTIIAWIASGAPNN